jgi:glycosyltransferase involved in cell wall biosynthesis
VRILLVDLAQEWRGGQSQALFLLRGLRDGGHDVELVSTSTSPLAVRAAEQEIPVYAAARAANRLAAASLIRRLLRDRHFDIVHVNEAHALTAAWLARAHRRAPLVIARRVTFPVSRGRVALARYRAAACIVAVSRAVREQLLAAGLDRASIVVVPDGVEIPPTVSAEARQGVRKCWNIAPGERVLALVASFTAEKGHALLLEAFAELHRGATEGRLPRCRLLLAGDGPLRDALERQATALGIANAVIFAGFVAEVGAVYGACDLFVFPSLHEGGGTSLLDAMAQALPVIATATGGIAEIVEDERNGLLADATPQSIAAAAARLLDAPELAQRLGLAARETVAARFPACRMVSDSLAVFGRLAAEDARGKG